MPQPAWRLGRKPEGQWLGGGRSKKKRLVGWQFEKWHKMAKFCFLGTRTFVTLGKEKHLPFAVGTRIYKLVSGRIFNYAFGNRNSLFHYIIDDFFSSWL